MMARVEVWQWTACSDIYVAFGDLLDAKVEQVLTPLFFLSNLATALLSVYSSKD